MKKAMPKVPPALLALCLVLVLLVGATAAYLSDARHVVNTLATGEDIYGNKAVLLSLEEPSFARQAAETRWLLQAPNAMMTYARAENLVPGQRIYKDPVVTNLGTGSFYLRVQLQLPSELLAGLQTHFGLRLNPQLVPGGDGYYYYLHEDGATPVQMAPGSSVYLFEVTPGRNGNYSMTVPADWKQADITDFLAGGAEVNFSIVAQAVQSLSFDGQYPWPAGITPEAVAANGRRPHSAPPEAEGPTP